MLMPKYRKGEDIDAEDVEGSGVNRSLKIPRSPDAFKPFKPGVECRQTVKDVSRTKTGKSK